jgi:hypothetical protein
MEIPAEKLGHWKIVPRRTYTDIAAYIELFCPAGCLILKGSRLLLDKPSHAPYADERKHIKELSRKDPEKAGVYVLMNDYFLGPTKKVLKNDGEMVDKVLFGKWNNLRMPTEWKKIPEEEDLPIVLPTFPPVEEDTDPRIILKQESVGEFLRKISADTRKKAGELRNFLKMSSFSGSYLPCVTNFMNSFLVNYTVEANTLSRLSYFLTEEKERISALPESRIRSQSLEILEKKLTLIPDRCERINREVEDLNREYSKLVSKAEEFRHSEELLVTNTKGEMAYLYKSQSSGRNYYDRPEHFYFSEIRESQISQPPVISHPHSTAVGGSLTPLPPPPGYRTPLPPAPTAVDGSLAARALPPAPAPTAAAVGETITGMRFLLPGSSTAAVSRIASASDEIFIHLALEAGVDPFSISRVLFTPGTRATSSFQTMPVLSGSGAVTASSAPLGRCGICQMDMHQEQPLINCHQCKQPSHAPCLMEWLKTNMRCPLCSKPYARIE